MKTLFFVLVLCICFLQMSYSQEDDGVVALALPVRNSLTFNRFALNPTFSFVREQNKYISFTNKREWVQFENAPLTYLGAYSGRFGENIGAGLAVFQQNYGVLTTFGGNLNFAYNARLDRDSNLTFGLNIGAYKSGVNTGNVVTNFDDPSLQNVPENFLITVNPGINYGLAFIDFGVSINNLATYNLQSSALIEDNPEQSIQGHFMYTGYMTSRGFFDEAKFTGLVRSEFKADETIYSAIAMLSVPKGIWAQVGYNSVFGASGGLGLNITTQIAIEYNYEKAIGDLVNFGSSHEITLAYRFKDKERYDYSSDDEVSGLFSSNRRKPIVSNISKEKAEENRKRAAERKAQLQDERLAREEKRLVQQEAAAEAKAQSKLLDELKSKKKTEVAAETLDNDEAKARQLAEQEALEASEAKKALLAKQKANALAEAEAKRLEKQKASELAEQQAKEAAQAQEQLLAEQKANEEAEAKARQLAEQQAKEAAQAQEQLLAEQKANELAEAKAKQLAEQEAKEAAQAQEQLLAEQKANDLAEAKAKQLAEQQAKEVAQAQEQLLAEQKASKLAEAKARQLAEQQAKEAAQAQEQLLAEQKANELAEAKAKQLADQQAKEAAQAQEQLLAEQKASELAETKATQLSTENKANDLISNPRSAVEKSMLAITQETQVTKTTQSDLLNQFDDIVEIKNKDLKDLKEENDLSEKGMAVGPKPFKSITAENKMLEGIKTQLNEVIDSRNSKIKELKRLYNEKYKADTITNDVVMLHYKKTIKQLETEQLRALEARTKLDNKLKEIKIATEFERRRRIKRAAFDSQEDRFSQDRATLKNIKATTVLVEKPYEDNDFDFGETQSDNIQILENVKNVDNGYYLILAVHNDVEKRNEFIKKVVASGRTDVDFFYDVNTSKYYIYYDKFQDINAANNGMKLKGNRPFNKNMSLVKIEN
ncbi:MAG: PorP/SprF family type IX secretion system membrane protein [Psychroserpens sp.]|uniref:PorP/SprF family type IX secretion system membrane protein n=2 Tax=Psychroserpens sp. TaxID=2020870 RepID=UPI003CC32B41